MLRWMVIIAAIVYFADSLVNAQEVPMIDDAPKATKKLTPEMFDFISKTLGSSKMAPHMLCTLKTRNSRTLRKFSGSQQWVETLEVTFNSNGFDDGLKMNVTIPDTAKYGLQKNTNQWSGLGEDIKIDLDDYYGHWLRFAHDGRGQIVSLILGNNLRTTPCYVR